MAANDKDTALGAIKDTAASVAAEIVGGPVRPKPHDSGSGANETVDGLDSSNEEIRRGAEDVPIGRQENVENVPVFERGDLPPKV
ncbi:MAG TPA: hypothetical protein VNQ99_13510 [Xanthobacteraceae bacterium]|nr:hypothetical protein [Xanthobacteraceae bacterium]